MSRVRLIVAVIGLVILIACYIAVPAESASRAVRHLGYWFTLAASLGLLAYAFIWARDCLRSQVERLAFNYRYLLGCSMLLGSLLIFVHTEFGPKVLMDDAILESTARSLHEDRQVYVSTYGRTVENQFRHFDGYVDKRPWLFAFAVSLMHDVSGFRIENAYLVNAVAAVGFLGLMHLVGWMIAGIRGALLMPAMWLTIPLFAQNATGSGMDLFNLFMLGLVVVLGMAYLRKPTEISEGAFALSGVLLAYGRYESLLFVIPVLLLIVIGWLRSGRILLSIGSVVAAPLLIGLVLQQKFFASKEDLWELHSGVTQPFALGHAVENFPRALNFFFSLGDNFSNSFLLGIVGFPAVIAVLLYGVRYGKQIYRDFPERVVLLVFVVALLVQFGVILCYHDGKLDRLFASRFALPSYLLLTLSILLLMQHLARPLSVWVYSYGCCLLFLLAFTLPMKAKAIFTERNFVVSELAWIEGILEERNQPRGLLVDRYTVYWTLRDRSALSQPRVELSTERIVREIREGKFTELILVDRRDMQLVDGAVQIPPLEFPRDQIELELIDRKSFKPFRITEVYRATNLAPALIGD
ncbi:hypothetical protein Caka_2293 [Coraliomargarita akajimensis DSM 45221]|uniref:Glycosyltransferase RgtA/B/C/D-like domain-containing protein n=2 Tax=Coraliomargarita TaxID=442430 RepID=D5EMS0_CORAD|nr:hypothetical protein Caka_2293 [Coraliomargarita akajimensis DSM 45221]